MSSAVQPAPQGKMYVVAPSQPCCRRILPVHPVSFDEESKDSTFFLYFQAPLWSLGASWWCERNLCKYWAA